MSVFCGLTPDLRITSDGRNFIVQTRSEIKRKPGEYRWADRAFCSSPETALRWVVSLGLHEVSSESIEGVEAAIREGVAALIEAVGEGRGES